MATYHLHADTVSRSEGQCVTASAAYRAGEKLIDERLGKTFDYTRRSGVLHSEIMAPANTPDWMLDREKLWNAVEKIESRKNSQLARDIEISLPHELDRMQRAELIRAFVQAEFVGKGMIADVAFHAPGRHGDQRNYHAHILLTMRTLTGEGFAKTKERDWNDKDLLKHWRAEWAAHVNRALERGGFEARVDHRSLEAQGIDREPQTHQGPAVAEMTARGIETDCATQAAVVANDNAERERLKAELETIARQLAALEQEKTDQTGGRGAEASPPTSVAQDEIKMEAHPITSPEPTPAPVLTPEPEKAKPDFPTEPDAETLRKQAQRETAELAQVERQEQARKEFVAAQTAAADKARAEQEQRERDEAARARSGDVNDAKNRYAQALADEYNIKDPYQSLARAAMNEYGRFAKQQEEISKEIAEAKTPEARQYLELQKQIEACDYMAITSKRLANISRVVTGDKNSEQSQRDEAAANFYQSRATELRAERTEIEKQRGDGKEKATAQKSAEATAAPKATPAPVAEKQPQPKAAPESVREIAYGQPPENPGLTPNKTAWNAPSWWRNKPEAQGQSEQKPAPEAQEKRPVTVSVAKAEPEKAAPLAREAKTNPLAASIAPVETAIGEKVAAHVAYDARSATPEITEKRAEPEKPEEQKPVADMAVPTPEPAPGTASLWQRVRVFFGFATERPEPPESAPVASPAQEKPPEALSQPERNPAPPAHTRDPVTTTERLARIVEEIKAADTPEPERPRCRRPAYSPPQAG